MGNTCNDLVWGWEAAPLHDVPGAYVPLLVSSAGREVHQVPLVVLDPDQWQARPIEVRCPMHWALLKKAPGAGLQTCIDLPDSAACGNLQIAARTTDVTRPLLEAACRQSFWLLPLSFLRHIIRLREYEFPTNKNLTETLAFLCQKLVPGLTEALLKEILNRRMVQMEDQSEDMSRLVEFEFILDIFTADDQKVNALIYEALSSHVLINCFFTLINISLRCF